MITKYGTAEQGISKSAEGRRDAEKNAEQLRRRSAETTRIIAKNGDKKGKPNGVS